MGSKKHKKESKKKKHRSRSRSPIENGDKERKRHRKHKDRKKDRSPDVEEVPVDSHLQAPDAPAWPPPRSASEDRDRRARDGRRDVRDDRDREYSREKSSSSSPRTHERSIERSSVKPSDRASERTRARSSERHNSRVNERASERAIPEPSGGAQESLSIEETNRLRAKLGLKPLEVAEKPADDGKIKDDLGEFYHKPAANISQQKKSDKIKEKLEIRREKRKIEQKLQTKLLGEQSDDEDASAWVKKSREIDKQKREAAKRAAMLDELDAEFGVSALVADELRQQTQLSYTQPQLKGLRVAHDVHALGDEQDVILTLADKEVLAEDNEDVLVNVNMVDDERTKKNLREAKKAKAGYQAYDEEAELQASLGFQRSVLSKYDDDDAQTSHGFVIGDVNAVEDRKLRDLMREEQQMGRRLESLQLPALQLATDYMDQHEIDAKFKKSKRKGKIRKKAKQEPIDVDDYDASVAPLHTDDTDVNPEQLLEPVQDEEETEPDTELQAALARARRLRQTDTHTLVKVEEILEKVKKEDASDDEEASTTEGGAMVLDATAEFCRTLGDMPTYGLAGNRDQQAQALDFEREEAEMDIEPETSSSTGAWSRVDVGNEKPPDLAAGSGVGLEAEPLLGAGVSGALRLALSKGYLQRAPAPPAPPPAAHTLNALHYSIEDKSAPDDDKYGRRERGGHSGPLQDFREKSNFRPNIKLEYVDDDGRPLCPKEAFRYLSHKFHGKGPGKNKQEKRIKKAVQEGLMKKMSSTDTPLNTLQMLQDKQRETHSPYIVLSGLKRDSTN